MMLTLTAMLRTTSRRRHFNIQSLLVRSARGVFAALFTILCVGQIALVSPRAGIADGASILANSIIGYRALLRPLQLGAITGAPGATSFKAPLALPPGVKHLTLAPGRPFAIAERENASPVLLAFSGLSVSDAIPLPGIVSDPVVLAFSPKGESILVASRSSLRIQVIAGLPASPRVSREIDGVVFPAPPADAAVSDDAGITLIHAGGGVYVETVSTSPHLLFNSIGKPLLRFYPDSANALLGDAGSGTLYALSNLVSNPAVTALAAGLPGMTGLTPDIASGAALVSSSDGPCIWSVNIATGAARRFDLAVSPLDIQPSLIGGVYIISSAVRPLNWLFVHNDSHSTAVFVPEPDGVLLRNQPRPH